MTEYNIRSIFDIAFVTFSSSSVILYGGYLIPWSFDSITTHDFLVVISLFSR